MKIEIQAGGRSHTTEFPEVPAVGDDIQIDISGAPMPPRTVVKRTWVVRADGFDRVRLDCDLPDS